ncbi:MAG TPA: rRNA maturation RNase YbeY [Bacteroidia bacterium]|nr:rRNA maturation RNase YbeY [Bacteroidia bacterium]HRH07135.1 rRNA maturation RNase YbeY [Bacteroidia bacterium]
MIHFFSEGLNYSIPLKKELKKWISNTILSEKKKCGTINYIFCTDAYLLEINKTFLNHHTLTDIITFPIENSLPSNTKETGISGEIYISLERVFENARIFNTSPEEELCRVMIHGILHLCGYSDKTTKQKAQMRVLESKYLLLKGVSLPAIKYK